MELSQYYSKIGAAYVRGRALRTGTPVLPENLTSEPLETLTDAEFQTIFDAGNAAELKLYRFKKTHDNLPRVRKVVGFLKSLAIESLLDVGSGRGVFLFPFLNEFPHVDVVSADILEDRIEFLRDVASGGVDRLTPLLANICESPLPEKSVDVVTLLEVLEHIPNVEDAVAAAVKTARQFVVLSVPSRPDDNPEHIHLLTKEKLTALFGAVGCSKIRFDGVAEHLIAIVKIEN